MRSLVVSRAGVGLGSPWVKELVVMKAFAPGASPQCGT